MVDRFTTITIQLDSRDSIVVNTLGSKCLANQYVYQIGPYGETKQETSVLRVLKDITDDANLIETQKLLFTTITESAKQGRTITTDDLYKINPKLRSLTTEQFNLRRGRLLAAVYLFYYLEITRRPKYEDSVGYKKGSFGKEETVLCCEVVLDAWTKVLTLLQKGALTLEDVFAKNALYGLPTGKFLRGESDQPLLGKIKRINDLYMATEYPEAVAIATSIGLVAIPSMEESHQRFLGCTTPLPTAFPATPKAKRQTSSTSLLESPGNKYDTPEVRRARHRLIRGRPRPFVLPENDDGQVPKEEDLMHKPKRRCLEQSGKVIADKENLDPQKQNSYWLSLPLLPIKKESGTASLTPASPGKPFLFMQEARPSVGTTLLASSRGGSASQRKHSFR